VLLTEGLKRRGSSGSGKAMTNSYTCACGAEFATPAQLQKHTATCNMARDPGADPTREI
jgi:hypothetical protein